MFAETKLSIALRSPDSMPLKTFSLFAALISACDLPLLSFESEVVPDTLSLLLLEQDTKKNSKQISSDKRRIFFIFVYLRNDKYNAKSKGKAQCNRRTQEISPARPVI